MLVVVTPSFPLPLILIQILLLVPSLIIIIV